MGSMRFSALVTVSLLALAAPAAARAPAPKGEKPVVRAETSSRRLELAVAADLTARIELPYGFVANDLLSTQATEAVRRVGDGSRVPIRGEARAWATTTRDAILVLTWVERDAAAPATPDSTRHARDFVTDFKKKLRRGMIGAKVEVTAATEKVGKHVAEARVEWSVAKQKLRGITRAQAVALIDTGFHGVQVQCVFLAGADSKRRGHCENAVASLLLTPATPFLALDAAAPLPVPAPEPATETASVPEPASAETATP